MGDSLETRRQQLEEKLSAKKLEEESKADKGSEDRKGYGLAVKLSSEFISAVFVGAMMGYLLDKFAGTAPWGMIIFLLLGFAAGIMNILRSIGAVKSPYEGFSKEEQ